MVIGKCRGARPAKEDYADKKQVIPEIRPAYEILAGEHDIIGIEGAGGPAEINLKQDDIVNMGLAKMLKAPVLLVGDIDRGGVFAQLAGTLLLLEEEERKFFELLCANESPVNNADKGAGYYLVRNTKVYLDAQGEIERLDGPLEYFKEKIIRLNLRKRYALIETAIRGEQQTAMLGIKLGKDGGGPFFI